MNSTIRNLPKYTFPVFGLLVGHPNKEKIPASKPRLPLNIIVGTDSYPYVNNYHETLSNYDKEVNQYYDIRTPNHPVPAFTTQIEKKYGNGGLEQENFIQALQKQGLTLDD